LNANTPHKIYPTELTPRAYSLRHMQIRKRHLSKHRVQRLILWTLAMLNWIAGLLIDGRGFDFRKFRRRRDCISQAWLTQLTMRFLILRAAELARLRKRPRAAHRPVRRYRHVIRSLIGSRLRRVFKHADPSAAIANLIHVLCNIDAYGKTLAQRFKRGLTRLNPITSPPSNDALALGPPASPPALLNSS